ncbi:maleylpyruvate isomerase family mycothiol-dependent enzyme [Streptomyces sp. NBC_01525]|uniref:maleylpyruvate isomerase family mycothiol-dependent enzyme n=1 Tax=Streptomyces sp. NBC_01525 TaxID=2903893 RepID=UPI003870A0CE
MTDTAPDFAHDVAAVHEATERLLTAVAGLDDAAVTEPSLLPDWTRGHVLAHLSRNADALVNLLTWARTDVPTPMYADAATRDADIRRDAVRPLAAQLDDLRESGEGFTAAARALPADRRGFRVEMRNGVVERADRLPLRRLGEVELHHVDLGIGYTLDRLTAAFVAAELDFLTGVKFAGHAKLPALELRTADGRSRRTGRAAEGAAPLVVTGPATALLGWLTGRGEGDELTADGGALPVAPPL